MWTALLACSALAEEIQVTVGEDPTFADALSAARQGDTIRLAPGRYDAPEAVQFIPGLTIVGPEGFVAGKGGTKRPGHRR